MEHKLKAGKHLKQRQQHQCQRRADLFSGARADGGLNALLLLCDGDEGEVDAAERDHVSEADGAHGSVGTVDADAALGADVRHAPASVVIARQDGVTAGNGGVVQHHVAAFCTPDKAFPMRDGNAVAGRGGQPRPDLRLTPEGKKRPAAAPENEQRRQRQNIPQNVAVNGGKARLRHCFKESLHKRSFPPDAEKIPKCPSPACEGHGRYGFAEGDCASGSGVPALWAGACRSETFSML